MIVYVSLEEDVQFFVTITEKYSVRGKLREIIWKGYIPKLRNSDPSHLEQVAYMMCEAQYDEAHEYLKGIFITDIVVMDGWRSKGFGSQMMQGLIRYAERLGAQYIHGRLSWVDIGTKEDEHRGEKRQRLCRFYERHGFSVYPNDELYRVVESPKNKTI